jgi:flagellar assembly factor FliW
MMSKESISVRIKRSEKMTARTTRFGEIRYHPADVVCFRKGLFGFENMKKYLIIEREKSRPFIWLQSIENPALALPIVDPLFFKPDYKVKVQNQSLAEIGVSDPLHARTFVIATIPQGRPENISINLMGPIIINVSNRQAVQIALTDTAYPTKYYLVESARNEPCGALTHQEAGMPA